jgi:tetratricopeptide (TPR) repeat protein
MTAGMKSTIIAHVDPKTLEKLQKNEQGTTNESTEPKVNKNPSVQDTTDEQLKLMFETAMSNGHLLTPLEGSAYQYFQKLKARPSQQSYSNLIRRDLAAELQNEAQGAINDYLAADPRELRKRWSFDDRYEKFPEYLSKSAELLGNEHFMYTRLKSREKYFHGLNLRLKGEKLNDKNLFQEAKIEQEEAIKLDSSASFAYNELGHLAILLGEYSKSLEYLNKCTQLSPKWVLPWSNMCSNFIEQGNLEQAEYFGLKAIALDSTFVMANYNLALVYRRQNNHQKSIQYNKAALQYDKDYAKAYFNLGLSYYHLEDYKNAEAAWEQYRQRMPDDPDIYQCLGEIAVKNGEQMNAEKHFNRALFLDPKYDGAFFSLGELYFTNQDLSSAEKAFQNYVALKPNDAEGFYQLARVYAQTKQVERALNSLESAFKLGKTDKQKVMGDEKLSPILSLQAFKDLSARFLK